MVRKKEASSQPSLKLPVLIFGVAEIRRLKREVESLEDYLRQSVIREPGRQAPLPRVSRLLEALATENNLQLLQDDDRKQLKAFLEYTEKKAPNLHISFAVDPSSAFTAKVVSWLRANIHPHALLEVGLQPTIAAGCIVRTNNKIFDFSLRERFKDANKLFVAALQAADAGPAAVSMTAGASASATMVASVTPASAAPVAVAPDAAAAQPLNAPVPAATQRQPEAVPLPSVTNVEDVAAQLAMPAAEEAAAVAQHAQAPEVRV